MEGPSRKVLEEPQKYPTRGGSMTWASPSKPHYYNTGLQGIFAPIWPFFIPSAPGIGGEEDQKQTNKQKYVSPSSPTVSYLCQA